MVGRWCRRIPIVRLPARFALSLSVVLSVPLGACFGSSTSSTPPGPEDASANDSGENLDGTSPDAGAEAGPATDGALPDAPADVIPSAEAGAPTSSTSIASGQLQQPQHLALDAAGNLYVASFAGSYSVIGPGGSITGTFGTSGAGQLVHPVGIAVDAQGSVYVGDYGRDAVIVFDASGNYKATFDGSKSGVTLGRITGVAVDSSGAVYAADDDNGKILKFDANGNVTGQITTQLDGGPPAGTTGMVFDGTDLWVAKYYDHLVAQLSASGAITATYGAFGTTGALGTFSQPYAIALGPGHVLYVADNGANDVQALSESGAFAWVLSTDGDGGAVNPAGLVVSADGTKLYVSDDVGSRILAYTLSH
jgi:sugar lactone lactonase YvrE